MSKSQHEFHRNIAIIIGINNYSNGVPGLETAVPDAEEFARLMQERYQYEVHLLLNEKATLNELKKLIDCFSKKKIPFGKDPEINDKDRIILYFAGHGIALDAKEKQEGPVGYLIPQDATDNPDTYLKMQDFHDALLELPCRHLLVILDCCFSGAFYWSSINRDVVPKVKVYKQVYDHYIKYPAWQVITSTSDKQTAIDSPRGKVVVGSKVHSPFAKHLFDALNKGADLDNDGIITANDLFNFVRKAVALETEEYKAQTPGICPLKRHQNGEYLFLLQSEPNLEDAPPLSLENSPYRGLKSYEEEDENLYFGRKEQIEQLSEKVNNSNHRALTVVLGASGTGKSSLVKAGLIPFLKKQKLETNSSLGTWQILKSIRLSESPLTALKNSLSQELNFIDYHSDCDQPQADEPKGFSKILSWFGIRRESNRAKQNQPLEKQVEFLSQNLKNWFDKNSGSTLMLTIDQFEELITLQPRQEQKEQNKKQKQKKKREEKHREKTQQELVLKWLPQVMSQYGERLRIVLTLRSDFEAQFKDGELKDYWKEEARFHIKEMTTAELREAITEPASKRSIFFVPNTLIDKLVDEVAGMPGTLPLLSFTLHELYRLFIEDINDGDKDARKDDRAITDKYYGTLGGVARSLTKKAEDEYDNLVNQDKAYEQTIRRVMLRMVAVGGSELARRRVLKSELEYPEPENTRVLKVVKTFVDARLLVEGNNAENKPYVEPAHDALVRGWERLLKWKQEEEENLILQRQLTPAAVEWKIERSQTKGYLWHNNPRLDLLKKELKSNDKWFNQLETEFVQLSIARKTLLARRFTIGAVVVIILLSAGLIASLIGQRNARIGQIRASQQASEANFISNQQLNALLNSLQAAKTLKDWPWYLSWFKPEHQSPFFESDNELQPQVVNTLRKVFYVGQERYRLKLLRQRVLSSFWVKDGDSNSLNDQKLIIATTPKKGFVRLLDLKDNLETTFKAHNDEVRAVTFSPPTNQMATISNEKIIRFWDLKGNNIAPQINLDKVSNDVIDDLVFSPDGKQLAITKKKNNNTYQTISLLCNLASKSCQNFQGSKDETVGVRFNLNNQPIVATKTDRLVNILEGTGKTIASFSRDKLGDININGIVFNPNGKQAVIFAGEDSSYPYLLNWSNSQNQTKLEPEPLGELQSTKITGFSDNGNFSPDGKKFASGGREGIIRLWKWENNLEDRTELPELKGHQGGVRRVYFSPDSKQLISIGDDGTTRLWDLDKEPLVRIESNLQLSKQKANLLAFSNDKRLIATLEKDGTILLSNLSGEQQLPTPVALRSKSIKEPLLSPDNQQLQANVHNEASGELANKLFLQDSSGNKLIELDETMNNTNNGEVLKFSADSNLMAKVDYNAIRFT
jgi:WD40 repeat protein